MNEIVTIDVFQKIFQWRTGKVFASNSVKTAAFTDDVFYS